MQKLIEPALLPPGHFRSITHILYRRFAGSETVRELSHLRLDLVAHGARLLELFLGRALKGGWVGKAPMQALGDARKHGAALRARLVADGYDVLISLPTLEEVEHALRLVARDIDSELLHGLHDHGVQLSRLKAGAFRL